MLNHDLTFLEAMNWKDRKWLESKKERMSHASDRSERNQEIGEEVVCLRSIVNGCTGQESESWPTSC